MTVDQCPKCHSENIYNDSIVWICPDCSHEWTEENSAGSGEATDSADIRDANGVVLNHGDSVIVIKDLKVKGASSTLKSGTKVRNIRLIHDAEDGHNIACKIDGIGAMNLKSEFVRKT